MILFQKTSDIKNYLKLRKGENLKIGFVPTMGALHAGHLSLINQARKKSDLVVCSIFVNPTQFNQAKDLETYPRPIENDIQLLVQQGCDILFNPNVEEIYADNFTKDSTDDYGDFVHLLEGESRPGHFDGVATVVSKFFSIIEPDEVFFGQKDYQQCLLIKTLINRSFPSIHFNLCPIERDKDGLALSSRNIRLQAEERELAPVLYKALMHVNEHWRQDAWELAFMRAKKVLEESRFSIEYFEICDDQTLQPINTFQKRAVILVAGKIGQTRLIDNLLLEEE